MRKRRVLIWSEAISDLLDGRVSGIGVQLYFWAQTFVRHEWQVTTFTLHSSFTQECIHFKHTSRWGKLEIIHEWLSILWNLVVRHPQLIIIRGASRIVFPVVIISKWLGIKCVFFGASDVNFEPGNELIAGGNHNRKLWQMGITQMDYIVVQNQHQQRTLKDNYGKNCLIIYNVWGNGGISKEEHRPTDVVWVANFRKLKRAEWMLNAAQIMSDYDFTLIGGPSGQERDYYDEIEQRAKTLPNLHFLGQKSFDETNAIVSQSRLLCCTSTFEGFPNTFLQAWANNMPVVSTVNPSNIITTNNLGIVVETEEEFQDAVQLMLSDTDLYQNYQMSIRNYFEQQHDTEKNYQKLMEYLDDDNFNSDETIKSPLKD